MNFLLKNLELELDDRYFMVGEKLLEDGRLTKLFENEPHLWIASVDGFEVELQISPSRVRACSCECSEFGREKMCGHVAAGLLSLRKKLSETRQAPKFNEKAKPRSYQKLTVNSVLDHVTQDELTAFVRNYARSNSQFSLALRTKFAAKVPLLDDHEKFGQLLDAAIQSHRKANDRISRSGALQLQKTLEELLGQADDAIALEHFAEAWAILAAVIGRFSPILKKVDAEEGAFQRKLQGAFEKLQQLVKLSLAPDLAESIIDFCRNEFNRPAYYLNALSGHLLDTWIGLSKEPAALEKVLATVETELNRIKIEAAYHAVLLKTKLDLLALPSLSASRANFLLDCLSDTKNLVQVLDLVETTADYGFIKDLVESAYRLVKDAEIKEKLAPILLQIAKMEGQKDLILTISRQKFLETKDFSYYEQCKANHKGNWSVFVKKLIAELISRYDYRLHFQTIATILSKENKLDDLLRLLQEQRSLEFLMEFDSVLLKEKREDIFELYRSLLKDYLSNHLGVKASQKLRTVFDHLDKYGAAALSERLFNSLKTAFPGRVFYMDEIEPNYF